MGIWHSLYKTYNNNEGIAGQTLIKQYRNGNQKEYMLLPTAHSTQTAHIEITLTKEGELYGADAIDKEITVLPFTEESGSRAGKSFKPHMLHDKLMYVSGDYAKYTGETDKQEGFENYRNQLKNWVDSNFSNPTVNAIYTYISKGRLIEDLIEKKVLFTDEQGRLLTKWNGDSEKKPKIFKEVASEQSSAFVRFKVHEENYVEVPWKNKELFDNYTNYYLSLNREQGLCFVTGEIKPLATSHPNKIRNSGDKAKLISSNDTSGFTFRGRFSSTNEAMSISYEASQKAHNALKFLIDRQGFSIDSRVFLLWGDRELDLPNANVEFDELLIDEFGDLSNLVEEEKEAYTKDLIAEKFNKLIRGYKNENITTDDVQMVHIIELDAATPGRMAVINYRSIEITEYLNTIKKWYQRVLTKKTYYNYNEKAWNKKYIPLTLKEIVEKVYGPRPDSKMIMEGISKLNSCVLNGAKIPKNMVEKLFQRSCMPQAYDKNEYLQLLEVATTIFIDKYRERGYSMGLQLDNNDRSYLFGRLLAVVDVFEERQLKESNNLRSTNALRYMTAYSTKPKSVYKTIFTQLQPYFIKAASQGSEGKWSKNDFIQKKIGDIMNQFLEGDFSNKPLDEQYILGYYNQRTFEYTKKGEI